MTLIHLSLFSLKVKIIMPWCIVLHKYVSLPSSLYSHDKAKEETKDAAGGGQSAS